ncbi:ROK family protein [Streptomyces sp. GESEQ-35]|uniref:ROK family protein n=1 Tax=Streptomyces sp. GESEQ-35 TaxID=2812657 RepID=UPI0027E2D409|nr:ROK family protein [Streptomyces sp. GESEQ-35]
MDTPLLCIKIASGIGAGIVTANGDVYRGADGAAGDIGHIRAVGGGDVLCACGNIGCVGALASHRAILRSLGIPETTGEDPLHGAHELAQRVANSDPPAGHRTTPGERTHVNPPGERTHLRLLTRRTT